MRRAEGGCCSMAVDTTTDAETRATADSRWLPFTAPQGPKGPFSAEGPTPRCPREVS